MLINKSNISFCGSWHGGNNLARQLNNEKELNELANAAQVDCIRTNVNLNTPNLPSDNAYFTTSSKKIDGRLFYGADCVILSKNTSKENLSKNIFKSAEISIGRLYGNIAKFRASQPQQLQETQAKITLTKTPKDGIIKKIVKFIKKV